MLLPILMLNHSQSDSIGLRVMSLPIIHSHYDNVGLRVLSPSILKQNHSHSHSVGLGVMSPSILIQNHSHSDSVGVRVMSLSIWMQNQSGNDNVGLEVMSLPTLMQNHSHSDSAGLGVMLLLILVQNHSGANCVVFLRYGSPFSPTPRTPVPTSTSQETTWCWQARFDQNAMSPISIQLLWAVYPHVPQSLSKNEWIKLRKTKQTKKVHRLNCNTAFYIYCLFITHVYIKRNSESRFHPGIVADVIVLKNTKNVTPDHSFNSNHTTHRILITCALRSHSTCFMV